jgi:glycosyltransferase involved in cell wall biosynthesis
MELEGRRGERTGIGVVIPARNEESRIAECLRSLGPFARAGDPIVVVDAASRDATPEVASRLGAELIEGGNPARGLAVARGYHAVAERVPAVLIVHADMVVPDEARVRIVDGLAENPRAVGGALGHRIDDSRPVFRWLEAGNGFRARRWQIPFGDQAQFVRKAAVDAAGGFPQMRSMEDLELSLRLRPLGPWLYLDCPVRIPSRHWRRGVVRTTARNWCLILGFRLRRAVKGPPSGRR